LAREAGLEPATAALAWVSQLPGVSTVIPGARNAEQAVGNAAAGSVDALPDEFTAGVTAIYDEYFRAALADRW
jgi:aryl-alcohol dehydrogenase-like predicted oxidoreductase